MRSVEIVSALASFEGRGPGTDAERRAARWLASELAGEQHPVGGDQHQVAGEQHQVSGEPHQVSGEPREVAGERRNVRVEPFWCRPNWPLAHLWHIGLAVVGSLLAVGSPRVGGVLLAIALVSVLADGLVGRSLGRRLSPERASQNVVASSSAIPDPAVRLIVTANYDAGRSGIAYRDVFRAPLARVQRATGALGPGSLGWLVIAIAWLLAVAILRLGDRHSALLGAFQLAPTVALVFAFALLLELALGDWSPAAGDNASGVAVAVALFRALDVAPPRSLSVELVLQGAGEGGGIGLRRHLGSRRRELLATNTIVLGFAPSGDGRPRWWSSDGRLISLRYSSVLRGLCEGVAHDETHLGAQEHRGRGATPAFPARRRRLPAIALGCLDPRGLVPRSHRSSDTASAVQPEAMDEAVQFGLMLVDAIDAFVGANPPLPRRVRGRKPVTTPA